MTVDQKANLRIALRVAINEAIDAVGIEAFKRISWFGSNDPAFKAGKAGLKQAA